MTYIGKKKGKYNFIILRVLKAMLNIILHISKSILRISNFFYFNLFFLTKLDLKN
jgi:hypothetical protein